MTTTEHDAAVERVARALCERHIRRQRRWDTEPADLEARLPASIDYNWRDHEDDAIAAIAALATTPPRDDSAEVARLREALQSILEGVPREVGWIGRQVDKDWCEHGVDTDQHCEGCLQDFIRAALEPQAGDV